MQKKAMEILSGFDRAIDRIEALPVPGNEKKRLVKEWLRSRLAEIPELESEANSTKSGK
jgi:hypothetical protein